MITEAEGPEADGIADPAPPMTAAQRLELARQVRPARRALNMTQDDLAAAAGVARNTVMGIESGARVPQADALWRVLGALDIRPDRGPTWTPEVESWVRIMASLVGRLPDGRRQTLMLEIVERLAGELGTPK